MGTIKHSRASRKRWGKVPKTERSKRMANASKAGWDKLTPRQRRARALKGVRTRQAKLEAENNLHEQTN